MGLTAGKCCTRSSKGPPMLAISCYHRHWGGAMVTVAIGTSKGAMLRQASPSLTSNVAILRVIGGSSGKGWSGGRD